MAELKSAKEYYRATFFNATNLFGELFDRKDINKEWFTKDEYIMDLKNLLMILGSLSMIMDQEIRKFENGV